MKRWAAVLICTCLLSSGCGGGTAEPASRPNVLLITLDTLRADHLGCYGYPRKTSPVLDRLAEESLLFERAIAQSAITPVSHASILTGLNPFRHGLRSLHGGRDYALPAEARTLAEMLGEAGYRTAAFVGAFPVTRHYGLDQGFANWDQEFTGAEGQGRIAESGVVNTGDAQRRGDETTERVLDWMDRRDDDEPFFLWVHYFDVHDPTIKAPAEYLGRFHPPTRAVPDLLRAIYDGELLFMDAQIGRLLERLERDGTSDRTIVAVVADHGEGLGDHDWWGHGILYQEQLRVPMLLRVPGRPGQRIRTQVRSIDLLPTLLELLGLPEENLDGASLVPLLSGEKSADRPAYSESVNDLVAYYDSPLSSRSLYSIGDGRYKLIVHREDGRNVDFELYDLERDPGEEQDLGELLPEEIRRLTRSLESLDPYAESGPLSPMDEETLEKLRSLGYVQ